MTMTEVREHIVELREVADQTPDTPPSADTATPQGVPDPMSVVRSLHATVTGLEQRIATVERRDQAPPPAETPPAPAVDLTPVTAAQAALGERMDGLERRLNRQGVSSDPSSPRSTFAEQRSLDEDMRRGRPVELRAVDVELLPLQVLLTSPLTGRYPFLDLCLKSLESARVRIGYYTDAEAGIEGIDESTQGDWRSILIVPLEYKYTPKLSYRDVQLIGSSLLDAEGIVAKNAFSRRLNKRLIQSVHTVTLAPTAGTFDEFTHVALYAPLTQNIISTADVDALIAKLPEEYAAEDAVFGGNKAMTQKLMGLVDSQTRAPIWVQSLAQGVPSTLRGYRYVEDAAVPDGRLMFGSPGRGMAVNEASQAALTNIGREDNAYRPCWAWLVNGGVLDPRATKVLDITLTGTLPVLP